MFQVLTIAGSDSGGGAGIQADIKTISALGGYAASVLTSVTAQNTLGVQGVFNLPGEFIAKQMDSVLSDLKISAAKTGMLANSEIIDAVAEKVKEYKLEKLVVDPVMVATSGDLLLEKEAINSLKNTLLPLAYLVTPNMREASVLAEKPVTDLEEMKEAAKIIYDLGPQYVLVKGGHLPGKAIDILYDGLNFKEFTAERISTPNTHGTGCTLSAAIATYLANGYQVEEAVAAAKKYLSKALKYGKDLQIGQGSGPVRHFYYLPEKVDEINDL